MSDLAQILRVNILEFNLRKDDNNNDDNSDEKMNQIETECHAYSDLINSKLKDYIFISHNCKEVPEYKWLMPRNNESFIKGKITNKFDNNERTFFKLKKSYAQQVFLLDVSHVYKCFSESMLQQNKNIKLFVKFLSECSVHTVISLRELKMDTYIKSKDTKQMISYLNRLWGRDHFSDPEDEIEKQKVNLARLDLNN